jgi:hypothetical protein
MRGLNNRQSTIHRIRMVRRRQSVKVMTPPRGAPGGAKPGGKKERAG